MFVPKHVPLVMAAAIALGGIAIGPVQAQQLNEDFEGAAGDGGEFFSGSGSGEVTDPPGWDSGLTGENASVSTSGNTSLDASAEAAIGGGVPGNAGRLSLTNLTFPVIDQPFSNVTGLGGGDFVPCGNPTSCFKPDWDTGLINEAAFAGVNDGELSTGTVSIQGLTGGGLDAGGGALLTATDMTVTAGDWFAGVFFDVGPLPNATPLLDPGFEQAGDGWGFEGSSFAAFASFSGTPDNIIIPRRGNWLGKIFGTFDADSPDGSSMSQLIDAQPSQTWQLNGFVRHNTGDSLVGTQNEVIMRLEFLDAMGMVLSTTESVVLNSASLEDDWIDTGALNLGPAPMNTTTVKPSFIFSQFCADPETCDPGAAHVDDISFKLVSGPNPVELNLLSLSADINGSNSGADYQLRIEDVDGNRLFDREQASGGWQGLGGNLMTAFTEADDTGTPTSEVFNQHSATFRVVVAYDNQNLGGTDWGTGGTLEIDNVFLPNTSPPDVTGSDYTAKLRWDQLGPITSQSYSDLFLSADVKGSVPDGAYELRLNCSKTIEAGGLQDFETLTGTVQGVPGGLNYFEGLGGGGIGTGDAVTNLWDDGIAGGNLYAFGGAVGGTTIQGTGMTAEGLPDGGPGGPGDGAAAIIVDIAALAGDTGWFAGLRLEDQGLASTDLTEVTLSAMVKGTEGGGNFGEIELRLEDGDFDRLFFCVVADGDWQPIGDTLDQATFGAAFNGGSNGVFDLDSDNYRVEIAFSEETQSQIGCDPGVNPWTPGSTIVNDATLVVDDLFLTPVQLERTLGTATFNGVATGDWQSVGGSLEDSDLDGGDFVEGFDAITMDTSAFIGEEELGGGCCSSDTPYIDEIQDENGVFGQFGSTILEGGGCTFRGCVDCGLDGGPGAQMEVQNVSDGFWFAVAFWRNIRLDLSAGSGDFGSGHDLSGLADIFLTADIKGTNDLPGQSSTFGEFVIRLEDTVTGQGSFSAIQSLPILANGDWQSVGGSMADTNIFEVVQVQGASGGFDFNRPDYTLTVVMVSDNGWGQTGGVPGGGTLSFDNLFLTGDDIQDAEFCVVELSIEDALATWGSGDATIEVDNINLGEATPCSDALDCPTDACTWCACNAGVCECLPKIVQADLGGGNGACPIDDACDGNDNFHALNCFSNSNTTNDGNYPCENSTPTPVANVDAGGSNGSCIRDNTCDGNDAFAALNCFSNSNTTNDGPYPCTCAGPAPQAPSSGERAPRVRPVTGVTLRAPDVVRPGELVDVDVHLDGSLKALRGYQLHLGVSGGTRGALDLVDISVDDERRDYIFAETPETWMAFNRSAQQMVVGMSPSEGAPTAADGYLATFTYRVPRDAAGTFAVELRYDGDSAVPADRTFLFGSYAAPIDVQAATPALIHVGRGGARERLGMK